MAKLKIRKGLKLLLEMNRDFFQNAFVTYLILSLIDSVWEKSVSFRLNLDNLLIAVAISGMISVLSQEKSRKEEKELRKIAEKDYILILVLGIMGALVVYHKTASTGEMSIPLSVISGLLMFLMSILILEQGKNLSQDQCLEQKSALLCSHDGVS